jgi:hypothetical protein
VFSVVILAAALFYTFVAFKELYFLSATGRPGPGFFPRFIGIGLAVMAAFNAVQDARTAPRSSAPADYALTVVAVAALTTLYVLLLDWLGGWLATAGFLFATLSLLNRGRHLVNIIIAALVPTGMVLLFHTWLNAAVPRGVLPLPF